MKKVLTAVMALFLVGCGGGGGEGEGIPVPLKTCSDFPIQERAQEYFDANGGSVSNNVDGLDEDGDGIVCEHLPHRQGGLGVRKNIRVAHGQELPAQGADQYRS
jgi:hypothetical protein